MRIPEIRDVALTDAAPRRQLSLRPYIFATTFTLVGLTAGKLLRHAYVPPAAPEPTSPADLVVLKEKEKEIDRLPTVKRLREDGGWRELPAYVGRDKSSANVDKDGRARIEEVLPGPRTLTGTAMAGTRGLGVQRMFWNEEIGELVTVVWFGQGLSGWPGVTHGGALATVLEESLRQVALGIDKDWTTLPEEPNTLNLSYMKPTLANNFYLVRATRSKEPVIEQEGMKPQKIGDHSSVSQEVDGRVETMEAKTLVKASGTFTLPNVASTKAEIQESGSSPWTSFLQGLIPKWST
ncbi:MAG: hypothetical protein M1820_003019 [Bogoriella megaspora]|nr:MAG: hypothetical protein M1820_003019 [Bogoriella megaspora]